MEKSKDQGSELKDLIDSLAGALNTSEPLHSSCLTVYRAKSHTSGSPLGDNTRECAELAFQSLYSGRITSLVALPLQLFEKTRAD